MDSTDRVAADAQTMGPLCDRCLIPLGMHGQTLGGQACDLDLALDDLR